MAISIALAWLGLATVQFVQEIPGQFNDEFVHLQPGTNH